MIEIEINTSELQATLNGIAERAGNTRPLMGNLARIMHNAVTENFEAGGRPAWAARTSGGSHAILQKSGTLKKSVTPHASNNEAVVGTNLKYAAIHHFGGTTAAHIIRPKNGKALKFGGRFAKQVNHPGSKIPARPFMTLQPGDEQALKEAVADYFGSLIRG